MRIVLSGGGTGGHIYPALAIKNRLQQLVPHSEFSYIGSATGLESQIVPENHIPFYSIDIQGLKRQLSFENLKTVWLMLSSIQKAKKLLKQLQPDVVIGTGGYVCAPVLFAASQLRIPTIIHEQNSVAGVTNKFLSRFVDKICICFPDVMADFSKYQNKIILTGNPRAQEVIEVKEYYDLEKIDLHANKNTILIFGGSRGAENINRAVIEALDDFSKKDYQIIMVTGKAHYDKINKESNIQAENISIVPYISDMPKLFNVIQGVVCRAGATTLTELQAKGLPSVLIPSPYVTNNHQLRNAQSMVNAGASVLLEEKNLTAEQLVTKIDGLMTSSNKRLEMSKNAQKIAITNATDRILKAVSEVTGVRIDGLE